MSATPLEFAEKKGWVSAGAIECHCFIDSDAGLKHWVNLLTGEIIKSVELSEQDKQNDLFS